MGGNQSISRKELLENDLDYSRLVLRAQQMNLSIIFQEDETLTLQNSEMDFKHIRLPVDKTDISRCLKELTTSLNEISQSRVSWLPKNKILLF